jgi:hypothetical protein
VNIALWSAQILLAVVFAASAAVKGTQSIQRTVELGMTGVVNVSLATMRLIAVLELLGVVGLFLPFLIGIAPVLTPLAALGLGAIMVLAARIHFRLGEPGTAVGNLLLLALCLFVAGGRWPT